MAYSMGLLQFIPLASVRHAKGEPAIEGAAAGAEIPTFTSAVEIETPVPSKEGLVLHPQYVAIATLIGNSCSIAVPARQRPSRRSGERFGYRCRWQMRWRRHIQQRIVVRAIFWARRKRPKPTRPLGSMGCSCPMLRGAPCSGYSPTPWASVDRCPSRPGGRGLLGRLRPSLSP